MKKNEIIQLALLELGFPYSDEDLEEAENYKSASLLLKGITSEICLDEAIPFNLYREKLKLSDVQDEEGKIVYLKPKNCLKIMSSKVDEYRGKLLSTEENLSVDYLKELSLEDVPSIYQRYLVLILASRLAGTAGKIKSLERIYPMLQVEKERIEFTENTPILNIEDLS